MQPEGASQFLPTFISRFLAYDIRHRRNIIVHRGLETLLIVLHLHPAKRMYIREREHFHPHIRACKREPVAVSIASFFQYSAKGSLSTAVISQHHRHTLRNPYPVGIVKHHTAVAQFWAVKPNQKLCIIHILIF